MRRGTSGFVVACAVLVLLGLRAYLAGGEFDAAVAQVRRSFDVIDALYRAELAVLGAGDVDARFLELGTLGVTDVARALPALEARMAKERSVLKERRAARADSETQSDRWLIITWFAALVMLIGSFLALRRSDLAHQRSSAFLDSIVENIPNMVFVKEAGELRFERINKAGEVLLGVTRAQLIGKNDFDFFPREEAVFFQEKDRAALASAEVVDINEEPIQTASGPRWLHTKKVPIRDGDGRPAYLLGISEDITERKRAAEELREAKDRAEHVSRELEAFSYSVAHDLRAPLRSIDGFMLALSEDNADTLSKESVAYVDRARAAAQRMGQLIDDLLSLSRVTRVPLLLSAVDLTALVRTIADELNRSQPERKVTWRIQRDMRVDADPNLLRIALENLLGNAWKFSSKQSAAVIEIGHDGDFFVRDNGAGFDMSFAGKLFGVFQRLHAMDEFPGTGIGLVTVQRIVERHGGRVSAKGSVGQGAEFRFSL